MKILQVARALLGAVLVAASAAATAQSASTQPIRLVVPIGAGGSSDTFARLVAQKLTEASGQSVIVENRPGASGIIGHDLVAKASGDGQTLLLTSTSFSTNPSLMAKLPHDTMKDFAPVTLLARSPYVLLVPPSLPVKSPQELVALAKAKPRALNYGSGGNGSGTHMTMELLKIKAGIDITHIPYKGTAPAITDLMGGQVQAVFVSAIAAVPYIKAGTAKAIGVTSSTRSALFPEVPTFVESGIAGFEEYGTYGVVAPGSTPAAVVQRLNAQIVKVMQVPELKARLHSEGVEVVAGTADEYARFLKDDIAKWAQLVKAANIRIE
jgi:Uncharacterized protein conserved in bacteria